MKRHLFTLIFIAASAINTGSSAENVYKCGQTYSQTPCPDATVLKVDDGRSAAQKQQTEEAARNDKKLADTLEKERQAEEKRATTSARKTARPKAEVASPSGPVTSETALPRITPKRIKAKTKKPDQFIAEVPGTEKKAPTPKTSKKNTSQN
jgi:hypothetical protein